jgi:hypothetical protein
MPRLLMDSHKTERLTMAIFDSAQDRQKIPFYAGLAPYISTSHRYKFANTKGEHHEGSANRLSFDGGVDICNHCVFF